MKKIGKNLFFVLSALLVYGSLASVCRAEVSISASVDRNRISLNESVRLSVTVSGGGNVPAPQLPEIPHFTIYSSGRSQNISFVNGQVSSSVTHTYLLSPKSLGKFTVGSFSVTVDGKTVQTQPIEIEVAASAAAAPQSEGGDRKTQSGRAPGAFVTMTADKAKAYLNEQVILTFRFYYRISLISNPEYQPPEKTGFIFEDLPPPRNFVDTAHGVQYHVTEIKTALFPTQTGPLSIPPASLKIRVEDLSSDPFSDDFFQQFFRGSGREYLLKSEPVRLTVLPLPKEGRPENFSGGVGEFKISAHADKSKLSVGEPLTVTVSVSGTGNIKTIGDPEFPSFTGFRKYDTVTSLNLDTSKGKVEGSKGYKLILVPQVSGRQTIPPASFSYFDPSSKKYKTVAAQPIPVELSASKSTGVVISPTNYSSAQIKQVQQEIRYIKLAPLPRKSFNWIHKSHWFFWINLFPVLGLALAAGTRWRESLLEKNPEMRRKTNAYKNLKKSLGRLPSRPEAEGDVSALFEIVKGYFADKMGLAPAGLTLKMIEGYLAESNVPETVVQKIKKVWADLEFAAYAPAQRRSIQLKETAPLILAAVGQLEKELQKPDRPLFKTILLLSLFSTGWPLWPSGQTHQDEQFQNANRLYQEGQFQAAKENYEELKKNGAAHFAVEYNLGNAYYQSGQQGRALAQWIRAWQMNPRDSDVRHNISLVSSQLGDPFFPENVLSRAIHSVFYFFNLNELSVCFTVFLWAASLLAIGAISKKIKPSGTALYSVFLIFGLALAGWCVRIVQKEFKTVGVVVEKKSEIRAGPGPQFGVGFTVPEGRRVILLNETAHPEWTEIGIPQQGLKGWALNESIDKI